VTEATKSLDADARWLKAHGVEGSFDQLRAKAFEALLSHKPLMGLPGQSRAEHQPREEQEFAGVQTRAGSRWRVSTA
jgi:hypothetical protein